MLFDWLVVGQAVRSNPASVVRGPRHVIKRGRTPILSPEEAHQLFESIPTDSLVGLRDRALIGVLTLPPVAPTPKRARRARKARA